MGIPGSPGHGTQAPLCLKKSQATLERRARGLQWEPGPTVFIGAVGRTWLQGDFGEKSSLEPEGSGTSLATPRGTSSLLKGKREDTLPAPRSWPPRAETRQTEGGGGPMGGARPGSTSSLDWVDCLWGPAGPYLLISSGSLVPPGPWGGVLVLVPRACATSMRLSRDWGLRGKCGPGKRAQDSGPQLPSVKWGDAGLRQGWQVWSFCRLINCPALHTSGDDEGRQSQPPCSPAKPGSPPPTPLLSLFSGAGFLTLRSSYLI